MRNKSQWQSHHLYDFEGQPALYRRFFFALSLKRSSSAFCIFQQDNTKWLKTLLHRLFLCYKNNISPSAIFKPTRDLLPLFPHLTIWSRFQPKIWKSPQTVEPYLQIQSDCSGCHVNVLKRRDGPGRCAQLVCKPLSCGGWNGRETQK